MRVKIHAPTSQVVILSEAKDPGLITITQGFKMLHFVQHDIQSANVAINESQG